MNLLCDQWIPVRRKNGELDNISPADITDDIASLCARRPDLDGGLHEFLIALFQTAMAPQSETEWGDLFREPPSKEVIAEALQQFIPYFHMCGAGMRFQQDKSLQGCSKPALPIERIFLNSPGDETVKADTDWFVKRNTIRALCLPCASAALIAIQTYATQGGQGHYVGMRGGGPLTTILQGDTLWQTIWLNIHTQKHYEQKAKDTWDEVFAWSTPRESNATHKFASDFPALHVFWSMPKRIWLDEPVQGICSLCLQKGDVIQSFQRAPQGIHYDPTGWRHPLSPYKEGEKGRLPVHAKLQEVMQFNNWISYLHGTNKVEPALVVDALRRQSGKKLGTAQPIQLKIFGFEADKTKVLGWVDVTTPLYLCPEEDMRRDFETDCATLVRDACYIQQELLSHITLKRSKDSPEMYSKDIAKQEFWHASQESFFQCIQQLYQARLAHDAEACVSLHKNWVAEAKRLALDIFDQAHCNHFTKMHIVYPRRKNLWMKLYQSKKVT